MSDFGEKVEWKNKKSFCNVVGSSGDKAVYKDKDNKDKTSDNWLETYMDILGLQATPACAVSDCSSDAEIGGHAVYTGQPVSPTKGTNDGVFLIPLCQSHNKDSLEDTAFDSKSPITVLVLNNYCIWGDGSCPDNNTSTDSICQKVAAPTPMPRSEIATEFDTWATRFWKLYMGGARSNVTDMPGATDL